MFHLCFFYLGVYISKTSYIRQGEESLDGFYRAWHHVEYYRWVFHCSLYFCLSCVAFRAKCWPCCYRYLRFFPDGHVIMLTTPEDPLSVVPRLRTRNARCTFPDSARMGTTHIKCDLTHWVPALFRIVNFLSFHRMDSVLLGHFRLLQETDNRTKVFAVVCKKKEEVTSLLFPGASSGIRTRWFIFFALHIN